MKVSVIVPVYNVEQYVAKCLESIKAQTLEDFECLVINDGSKDDSIKIAKETVKDDKRFKFYDKENGGLSDARNYGIEKASGEYLCFIDSDDYVDKELLELSYNMGKENNSDIVCFDMYYVWEDGNLEYSWGSNYKGTSNYKDNPEIIFSNNSANNKLYKASFMKNRRFFKGMWYEDMAVIPVWIAEANNMAHVYKPLYYYVQRQGSITHKADERLFDIYKSISMVKDKLQLGAYEVRKLFFDNCLVMTTLRIKEFDDKDTRIAYYKKNIELLESQYPNWYSDIKKDKDYNFKQKVIFTLYHLRLFNLVEKAYHK